MTAQIVDPTAENNNKTTAKTTNKANAEVEPYPLKAEVKIRKYSEQFKFLHTFWCFLFILMK